MQGYVRKLELFDQDEAAMREGEGAEETERAQEKLGRREGRKLRRGKSACWRGRRGGTAGIGGAAEVVGLWLGLGLGGLMR